MLASIQGLTLDANIHIHTRIYIHMCMCIYIYMLCSYISQIVFVIRIFQEPGLVVMMTVLLLLLRLLMLLYGIRENHRLPNRTKQQVRPSLLGQTLAAFGRRQVARPQSSLYSSYIEIMDRKIETIGIIVLITGYERETGNYYNG